ncbi:RNA-directed DNA polymerase, eukaryota, reverse transcriptase zinc-binding domain protein, partial [Tanacetum coccineum]
EDEELDCLISSFQRLNEVGVTDVQSMANKKRKSKPKKKKLVVGTSTAHQTPSKEVFGEDYLSQNIGALIGTYVDFAFCSSHGASGGILTIWDSRMFSIDTKFVNKNFLCVVRTWVGITAKVGLLNIYAPQSPALKDQLWFGCVFDTNEANSFNDFISWVGFIDFPLGGRRFTRFDKNGSKASKLDRFLVSGNFFDYWIDASVVVLYRSLSDHCPLLLKVGTPNFGPKPYRVKEDLKKQLLEWDVEAEKGLINDLDVAKREEWLMDLDHLDQIHRLDLKQNAILDGRLKEMRIPNSSTHPESIKKAAFEHFSARFKEGNQNRPQFTSNLFRRLLTSDSTFLDLPFSLEEIKEAVWGCDGSKAPGPDGFNFNFVKTFWDIIKNDFRDCIEYFESSGFIANGWNPSFIVLIPKSLTLSVSRITCPLAS